MVPPTVTRVTDVSGLSRFLLRDLLASRTLNSKTFVCLPGGRSLEPRKLTPDPYH